MRSVMAGLLVLLLSSTGFAQAKGQVLSIGLNNHYRAGCWVAMRVQITSQTTQAMELDIRVIQKDLDGDVPLYTKRFSLTPNIEGQAPKTQDVWAYFVPQSGLPSRGSLRELQEKLQAELWTKDNKFVGPLPITSVITNVDELAQPSPRGTRFVAAVTDPSGQDNLLFREYDGARGILEDVAAVPIRPVDLPENVLGYDGVDVIVWADAPPPDPKVPTEEAKMRALQAWVRQGGHLVILQTLDAKQTAEAFGELMPVLVAEMADRTSPDPLRLLANPGAEEFRQKDQLKRYPWQTDAARLWADGLMPPANKTVYKAALADAKPGAIVEEWMEWAGAGGQTAKTPWLVRQRCGLGAVTWVAQDLGSPVFTQRSTTGWSHVWDRVLDWKNETMPADPRGATAWRTDDPYASSGMVGKYDFGAFLQPGLDMQGKSGSLIFLAVLFFIGYWVVAGPGTYLFLLGRKRTAWSWFLFALSAVVATALTVLIVQLVLRGPPQVKHVTVVRTTPGEPAVIDSRFGLYIPRDGRQTITLTGTAAGGVSHLEAYALPTSEELGGFTARLEYPVMVRDMTSPGDPSLTVPYRSTLKKLQARYVGEAGGITGQVKVRAEDERLLEGRVVNNTGRDLRDVYFVYKTPAAGASAGGAAYEDRILYVPSLSKGQALELGLLSSVKTRVNFGKPPVTPGDRSGEPINDVLMDPTSRRLGWEVYWYADFRGASAMDAGKESVGKWTTKSFPMLSLFGRLPPIKVLKGVQGFEQRAELQRRGARFMDISAAVAGGSLVVLAEGRGGLPFGMEVNEEAVQNAEGVVFYQSVIPLERPAARPPTTQESE